MKKGLLIIAVLFITVFASAQTDLFISEYCEGSGNNKGVEIYNPTNQTIDLSVYYIVRYSNGSSVFTEGGVTQLQGMLEPYKTHVLVNGQTTSTPTSPACSPVMQALANQLDHDYPAPMYMNGNDAIALIKTPNGDPPNATNVTPVDLFGEIGLGSLISAETGWSYVQDSTLSYNNSQGEPITGKVENYIVQKYATNGSDFGPFWMSWTSDHSLIRKPNVVQGVVTNPSPFSVSMEWDTVPAKLDSTGYYSYKDIWDNLGSHACVADPNYPSAINEPGSNGSFSIFPNPVTTDYFNIASSVKFNSVQVFDVLGQEVYTKTFASPVETAEIRLGSKYHGIYLIKANFTNNRSFSQKILIK